MRRCFRCGAKMKTNYIVCPECEKKIDENRRKLDRYHYYFGKRDVLKTLENMILPEHNKMYETENADEWTQGEHFAYHRVLQMISDLRKTGDEEEAKGEEE